MFKKLLKSAVALATAAAMTLGAASMVSAAGETATLTLGNTVEGNTYTAYTVMTATKVGDDLYTYQVNPNIKGFFDSNANYQLNGDNEIQVKSGDAWVTLTTADQTTFNAQAPAEISKFASALDDYLNANNSVKETLAIAVNGPTQLPIGYYLVTETMGQPAVGIDGGTKLESANGYIATRPILVNLTKDKTVNLKNDHVGLDKVIVEDGTDKKENNVNIGDDVNYKVTSAIPTFKADVDKTKLVYEFTDTFSEGLTFNDDLAVSVGGETITAGFKAEYDNGVLTIAFDQDTILNNQGKDVELTYSAKLNVNAKVNDVAGNPNNVTLKYNNNPNSINDVGYLNDEVKTFTYGFKLRKVDKNDDTADMSGTIFQIKDEQGNIVATYKYNEDGKVSVLRDEKDGEGKATVTIEAAEDKHGGYASISGLDEGTYTVAEVKALSGYSVIGEFKVTIEDEGGNKPNGKAVITIEKNNAPASLDNGTDEEVTELVSKGDGTIDLVVKVENVKGISLPETGAKTAMYSMILGAILLLIGGLFYGITRKGSKNAAK